MKCLNQNCDADKIKKDDNFCYKCGYWTTKGFSFLGNKENVQKILNGASVKQGSRLSTLFVLFLLSFILFTMMLIIRGNDLFKPFFYLKKQAINYIYGYNTSLMKTDNKYNKSINSYAEAIDVIIEDAHDQEIYCFNTFDVEAITNQLESDYNIPSVSFCDMSIEETKKIEEVIVKMYDLFPTDVNALTNITITNAESKDEYIARFQPMYQFVNINSYNKVNKTQILLNSYYFLNDSILYTPLKSVVGEDWYVKDATWESTIAHELGHYYSFVTLLNKYGLDNITYVTKENSQEIDEVLNEFNSGEYSMDLLTKALNNYNSIYNLELSLEEFASIISKYASSKDDKGNIIADETIAEAIHDYYLHGDSMQDSSREIVNVIKSRL